MIETIFKKITRHYGLAFLVIWLGSQLLANPETPYLLTLLGVFIVHAWVYFVHRGLHIAHDMKLLDYFNTHMRFHHQSEKDLPRPLELFFECIGSYADMKHDQTGMWVSIHDYNDLLERVELAEQELIKTQAAFINSLIEKQNKS